MNSQRKIFTSREELARALEERRKRGENIVFTNGCFDIIHPGHARLLRHARAQGDLLAVGVNDDASVSRLKGPHRPILLLEQRLRILAGFAAVDYVIAFSEDTPAELIEALRPDTLVKGEDYQIEEIAGRKTVLDGGGRVIRAPLLKNYSTQGVIQTILERFGSRAKS